MMTKEDKRVYLAAHAPLEIPEDFVHKQPPQPKRPKTPNVPKGRSGSTPLKNDLEKYSDYSRKGAGRGVDLQMYAMHGGFNREELDALTTPYYEQVAHYFHSMELWENDNRLARMAQWPWAWADMLLKYE